MTSSRPASERPLTAAPPAVEGSYIGSGGLTLFRQVWRPANAPAHPSAHPRSGAPAAPSRGVLVYIHGLGDHSGLHPYLVEYAVRSGWTVHAPDLRGNGRSPGQRAYVASWEEFRDDLRRFLAIVRAEEGDVPLFLLGYSLGGLIVLDYALDRPEGLDGVIAVSPPVGRLGVPRHMLLLAELASRVWPRLSLRTGMDLSGLARDPAIVHEVLNDPLFHRFGTARLGTEVQRTIARLQREAARFTAPLLILHGGADRMVPPDGSREFIAKAGSTDKQYREYPGDYHALFADYDRDTVLADLERWMSAHTQAHAQPQPRDVAPVTAPRGATW